jgi:hypothetical protein
MAELIISQLRKLDSAQTCWKDKFHRVRLRFSPEVALYLRERQWHLRQKIQEQCGGGPGERFRADSGEGGLDGSFGVVGVGHG